jgi:nucleoside-diphosphate-sugar epimerase
LLNIDDAVRAYLAVLEAPGEKVDGRVFNVLNDNYQIVQVAYQVRRALEHAKGIRLDLLKQEIGPVRTYRVDGARFRTALGLDFPTDMSVSVEAMWDRLEEGIDYTHPIYYNLAWLELLVDMERRLRAMNFNVL